MIEDVIIIHLHELTLKGKNRSWFEKILINNLKDAYPPIPNSLRSLFIVELKL